MAYKYWTTNLLTGAVTADNIPLTVQSFSRSLGQVGSLTGNLVLSGLDPGLNRAYVEALEPRRTVLWVSQDGVPIWAGILWDWTHMSILDGTLPISASTMESIFQRRQIDTLQSYSGDVYDTVRSLLTFALSKTPNGQVAGLTLPPYTVKAGVSYAVTYQASDNTKVWDAITSVATAANFEATITPALGASGNPIHLVQLGLPQIGQPASSSSVTLTYPGNVYDYAYPRTGSTSANSIRATAPPNGSAASWVSQYPHGQDQVDLNEGYPLVEDSMSYSGVGGITSQAQINAWADGKLPMRTGAQETPIVTIAPGQHPLIREISLGDWVQLVATSPLHPASPSGAPGLQTTARITGWTIVPPGSNQVEQVKVTLGSIAPGSVTLA